MANYTYQYYYIAILVDLYEINTKVVEGGALIGNSRQAALNALPSDGVQGRSRSLKRK